MARSNKNLKIAIDLRWLRSERFDGIARYSVELSKALTAKDPSIHVLYHREELLPLIKRHVNPKAKLVRVPYNILTISDFLLLPSFLRKNEYNVYISPNYTTSPLHSGYKVISVVHDLIPFFYKKYFGSASLKWRLFYSNLFLIRKMLQAASVIVAVSRSTKHDLVNLVNVPENKVRVIYEGVDPSFKKIEANSINGFLKDVGLDKSYIIFVGTLEPRKNIVRIIQAYNAVRKSSSYQGLLVIVGKKGWQYEPIFKEIEKSEFKNSIKYMSYVKDSFLPALISGAEVLVYPSLYEGFGLPILEGMACGTPVITSKISSMPEVGGPAAFYVDPYNVDEIAGGLSKIVNDQEMRSRITKMGYAQLKKFSWDKTAEEVLKLSYGLGRISD